MVTLITEQLRKQSLEETSYSRAFSLNVSLPEVGASPTVSWGGYGFSPESSWSVFPPSEAHLQDVPSVLDPLPSPLPYRGPFYRPPVPSASDTDLSPQSSPPPPPPPPKRHCRSLSVPEDLSGCRAQWRPSASKIWTPVKRRCYSGGAGAAAGLGSALHRGPSSSLASSSSSPTFFSLAHSSHSPLPWTFPWEPSQGGCASFFPTPSSCSSSPVPLGSFYSSSSSRPLLQRRFSLSPVHVQRPSRAPSPVSPTFSPLSPGMEALAPSPSSSCSTPTSSRRAPRPALPRCHSQPCDMRKPRLKRRHDSDALPGCRPGLDFSKMTQIGSGESLACGEVPCLGPEPALGDLIGAYSPAEFMGRTSIVPLSESEEEEEEEEEDVMGGVLEDGLQNVFERDCTELDLNLIEEN